MSSFVGHALAALTIGKVFEENTTFTQRVVWQICLVACAFAPDIDYVIPSLNFVNNNGLRITHTVAFCLIIPIFLMFFLFLFRQKDVFGKGMQAALAGISHLILDLLVGSRQGDPLFYPLTKQKLVLPFGILPSAGEIRLTNYFFYRNTLIELAILLPVSIVILHYAHKLRINKLTAFCLFCIFAVALVWSIGLKR
jgi:membrane-bound metal-dependent hydrolase YbcI (DUF457 family)